MFCGLRTISHELTASLDLAGLHRVTWGHLSLFYQLWSTDGMAPLRTDFLQRQRFFLCPESAAGQKYGVSAAPEPGKVG